jgi:glycerate kinase
LERRISRPDTSMNSYDPFATVLIAPDAFKGTLRASEVARAIAHGVEAAGLSADPCPVADGGEGTAEALLEGLGGEWRVVPAHDPLGRRREAPFALLVGGRAIVEVAAASGLNLVAEAERDAEGASSQGTGELIAAAVAAGAREVLVAAGGSATTDGGAGALAALTEAGGLDGATLTVLCDVRTPWERAAEVFAPQKGADAEAVARLADRLDALADRLPRDPRGVPMTGAAGGLSGGLWATVGARLAPGAGYVLDAVGFDERLRRARAVITGEGRIDAQTLEGKLVGEVATRARQAGVPAYAVVGRNDLDPFDARVLDLQQILEAGDLADLERAGRQLARLVG